MPTCRFHAEWLVVRRPELSQGEAPARNVQVEVVRVNWVQIYGKHDTIAGIRLIEQLRIP
jgi:hypothetical protein